MYILQEELNRHFCTLKLLTKISISKFILTLKCRMKKITDYNAELDLHFEKIFSRSKRFNIFQIVLFIPSVILILFFWPLDKGFISSVCILLPIGVYLFIHTKIQAIICLYLRDKNTYIYDKYKPYWSYVRGYYPLANINLFDLNKKDLGDIKDGRIITLIQAKRKATLVCFSCCIILILLSVGKSIEFN